jgi:hypothetical protein
MTVQTSTDLKTWTNLDNASLHVAGIDPQTGDQRMTAQVPMTSPSQFVRVNVTMP